jgi:hypothetical protein
MGIAMALALGGCYQGTAHGTAPEDTDGASDSATSPTGPTSGTTDGSDGDDTTDLPEPPEPAQAPSSTPRVKFKGPTRLANDLSRALELDRDELCHELSSYDCFETHNIALGGVEAYDLGVHEPLDEPGVSSPIAADRIALSACGERAALDFGDPGAAVVFVEIANDPAQADPESLEAAGARLYRRLLRREPEARELGALVAFYDEIPTTDPARAESWAHLSCFALATMLENLFY